MVKLLTLNYSVELAHGCTSEMEREERLRRRKQYYETETVDKEDGSMFGD